MSDKITNTKATQDTTPTQDPKDSTKEGSKGETSPSDEASTPITTEKLEKANMIADRWKANKAYKGELIPSDESSTPITTEQLEKANMIADRWKAKKASKEELIPSDEASTPLPIEKAKKASNQTE